MFGDQLHQMTFGFSFLMRSVREALEKFSVPSPADLPLSRELCFSCPALWKCILEYRLQ